LLILTTQTFNPPSSNLGARVTAICGSRNKEFVRSLGADNVIEYDTVADVMPLLVQICKRQGQFDVVVDTVSSHDKRDSAFDYEKRLRKYGPALMKQGNIGGRSAFVYVILGGGFWDWFHAHLKRFLGIDLMPHDRLLFWVNFSNSTKYLKILKEMCEQNKFRVQIGKIFPFNTSGVQDSFEQQLSRRQAGKIVINVTSF
jgi:NADPH:quinone reductase-like Zn-dependent oxidoreductase